MRMPPEQNQGPQGPDAAGPQRPDQAVASAAQLNGSASVTRQSGPSPSAVTDSPPGVTGVPVVERKVFRLPGAIVAWWGWAIIAIICLGDIVFTGRNHTGAEVAATVLLITSVVYACALRPRVVASPAGITVQNPFRDHTVPWGSVDRVDLRESVRVHCEREPGAKRAKIIHSWALYAQRRRRLRSEMLRQQGDRRRLPRSTVPTSFGSSQAEEIQKQVPAQIMAEQLAQLVRDARLQGAAAGPRVVTWAWPAVTAVAAGVILLVLVLTVFS
jgi:hypothetical protein